MVVVWVLCRLCELRLNGGRFDGFNGRVGFV